MSRVIPDDGGPIIVYYATYERGRIVELAQRHPQHEALLQSWLIRIVDLHPFVKANYYHPEMEGSFSIKKVLRAVAPDLDYGKLEQVQDGTGAQLAYLEAAFDPGISPQRKAKIRKDLLAYCRQDTWAMVVLAHFLQGSGSPVEAPQQPEQPCAAQ